YILSDGMAVMSLRGIAKLLDMDHAALVRMVTNSVKIIAKNSPYQGRSIVVFNTETISKKLSNHIGAIWIFIHYYNANIILCTTTSFRTTPNVLT
ncbi:MAG: hypothetical protein IMF12_05205, partial [Proteobacteria bacterium]|nr:hypothetical protein [Pseudomonadota bacterium]